MRYMLIGLLVTAIWIAYEYYRAPNMDEETGKIIKPGKSLKDLWRKK